MLKVRQVNNIDRNITSQLVVVLKKFANTYTVWKQRRSQRIWGNK